MRCDDCRNFINNLDIDKHTRNGVKYGSYSGIGQCSWLNEKFSSTISVKALIEANAEVGGQLLYPYIERSCRHFYGR